MRIGICQNCEHLHQYRREDVAGSTRGECHLGLGGECRRDPPIVPEGYHGGHRDRAVGKWPTVLASSGCSQHAIRDRRTGSCYPRPEPHPTDIIIKWNPVAKPVLCSCCELQFTPPVGPCLTVEGTWEFVCLKCAEKLIPEAARDCRLLRANYRPDQAPRRTGVGMAPEPQKVG